ncbi:hypothetical protein F5Y16DRAFT_365894 [Xylariaceae sp. FL0255]|nr:hypothetical protein F5Y16DRAFT_365894 [Xylariaceae sp. FL0255]
MRGYNLMRSIFIRGSIVAMAYPFAYPLSAAPQHQQVPLTAGSPQTSTETPPSRRIVIHTNSKPVSGAYPLYDLLSISTQSGSISVSVTPHAASSEDPADQPTSLQLNAVSGSVYASLDAALDVPAREYITSVSSQGGSVSGTYPLGTSTSVSSRSGSLNGIELVVMPSSNTTSKPRQLRTAAHSGSQSVRIVDDSFFWTLQEKEKEVWWDGMVSRHESQSGSLDVQYPSSWQGMIDVDAGSGSVSITGRGVEIIREYNGRYLARKGDGSGGKVYVKARSGSVNLRFG